MAESKIEIRLNPLLGITRIRNGAEKEIGFGMSQAEVEKVLGKATQYCVNRARHNTVEPRDGMQFTYSLLENDETALCEIEIQLGTGLVVTYKDIHLFEESANDVVQRLSQFGTPTPNNGKYIMFYNLGICLGGYGLKRIPEKKMVLLFSSERQNIMEMMFRIGGGKI